MTVIATDVQRLSNLVKQELWPEKAYCREVVTYNGAAASFVIGQLVADDGTVPATEADIYGVVMQDASAALNTDTDLLVLARGPVSISKDALILGLLVEADVVAQLKTLGFQVLDTVGIAV
jgi:hypothetical protein